jgi:hypothetical protein
MLGNGVLAPLAHWVLVSMKFIYIARSASAPVKIQRILYLILWRQHTLFLMRKLYHVTCRLPFAGNLAIPRVILIGLKFEVETLVKKGPNYPVSNP